MMEIAGSIQAGLARHGGMEACYRICFLLRLLQNYLSSPNASIRPRMTLSGIDALGDGYGFSDS
jgi:hypothetical protein